MCEPIDRAAEIIHDQVHYDTPAEVTSCMTCHDAVDSLSGHGALATPAHDAAVAAEALREAQVLIKARVEYMTHYDPPSEYMQALNDAWGLIANRRRDVEREGGGDA